MAYENGGFTRKTFGPAIGAPGASACQVVFTYINRSEVAKSDEKIKAGHNFEVSELDPQVSPRDPIFSLDSVHAYALWTTSA